MSAAGDFGRILLVDKNLFFARRLGEALRHEGLEVMHCTQPDYALTMVEWNMPVAILCAADFNRSDGFEIPQILAADAKTSHIPVIAIGTGREQALLQAFRAGYDDYVDRRLGAENIAAHVVSFLSSRRNGFQPTQMLAQAETALDGRLSHFDLPGVIQMLAQSQQTGALHINAGATDGIIFFSAGEIFHAESGQFAGDDAAAHLVKNCQGIQDGVYKFIPGRMATTRTVHRGATALILDALRELDEQERDVSVERG